MDTLITKSAWIFAGILLMIALPAVLPIPVVILFSLIIGSLLVLVQVYVVLKDDGKSNK